MSTRVTEAVESIPMVMQAFPKTDTLQNHSTTAKARELTLNPYYALTIDPHVELTGSSTDVFFPAHGVRPGSSIQPVLVFP